MITGPAPATGPQHVLITIRCTRCRCAAAGSLMPRPGRSLIEIAHEFAGIAGWSIRPLRCKGCTAARTRGDSDVRNGSALQSA